MSLKKTLLLAVLLIVSVLYISKVKLPQQEQEATKGRLFKGLSADAFSKLEITRAGKTFGLVKPAPAKSAKDEVSVEPAAISGASAAEPTEPRWELEQIKGAHLEDAKINQLLSALTDLDLSEEVKDAALATERAVYGFEPAAVALKVEAGDRKETLELGKENTYFNKRYLAYAGKLYLVTPELFTALDKARDEYRDPTLVEFSDAESRRITLERTAGGSSKLVLERVEEQGGTEDRWRIVEPINFPASNSAVSELRIALRALRASRFVDDVASAAETVDAAKPGPRQAIESAPDLKALIELKGSNRSISIALKEKFKEPDATDSPASSAASDPASSKWEASFVVQGNPSILEMSEYEPSRFKTLADAYRERQLCRLPIEAVHLITISPSKGDEIRLVRKGDEWTVNQAPADAAFVKEYLGDIDQLSAKAFPQASQAMGFERPTASVEFLGALEPGAAADKAPASILRMVIGSETVIPQVSKGYFVHCGKETEAFIMGDESLKDMLPPLEVLKKVEPEASPSAVPTAG